MFANGPGDLGSIPGQVIPKTQKMVLDASLLIRYGSRVKWSNPGKVVAPSPTPWCSKLSKREPLGHPRLWSPTLLTLYFSKNCVARLYCVVVMILHAYVDVYVLCVCIVGHGYTTSHRKSLPNSNSLMLGLAGFMAS